MLNVIALVIGNAIWIKIHLFLLHNIICKPPSPSALTPIISYMELTHLGSKASIYGKKLVFYGWSHH